MVHLNLLADGVELGVGVHVPGVAHASGPGDGGVAVGGHPHRRMGLLHGAQHELSILEPEVLALVVDLLAGPQQAHGLQALQIAADPGAAGHAEVVVFLVAVAQGGAQCEVAAGDHVHGGHPFRQVHRMMQGHQHGGHETHAPSLRRNPGQQRHRLQLLVGVGQVVLALVDHVEPQVARRAHVGADVGEGLLHVGAGRLLSDGGKGNSEFHCGTSVGVGWLTRKERRPVVVRLVWWMLLPACVGANDHSPLH